MLGWFNIRRNTYWAGALIGFRLLVAFAIQKLVAIKFGAAGTALFAHFQNLLAIITQPIQDVVGQGLISAYPKPNNKKQLFGHTIILTAIVVISLVLLTYILKKTSLQYFNFSVFQWLALVISILLVAMQLLITNLLVAKQRLKWLCLLFASEWLFILAVLQFTVFSITQLLWTYLVLQGGFTVVFILLAFTYFPELRFVSFKRSKHLRKHFRHFLYIGATIWFSSKVVDFVVRAYAIETFGSDTTGYWQAAVRISDAYRGLFISFLMLTAYPKFSALANKSSIQEYIKTHMPQLFISVAALLLGFYVFAPEILTLLYNSNYAAAVHIMRLQILGDFFALLSYPFALLLMAQVQSRKFIMAELAATLAYSIFIIYFREHSIKILLYANLLRYVFYSLLMLFFTKNYWKIA